MRRLREIVMFITVAIIVVFASSCGGEEYEPSTIVIEDGSENVMTISVKEVNSNNGLFVIENCGEKKITYGDRNYLEKHIDGQWMGLVVYNQRTMTEPSYELWPGESKEYETEWEDLEAGEYRYVLPFTVVGDETEGPGQSYYIAALFTI